jgi:hypothetical protein
VKLFEPSVSAPFTNILKLSAYAYSEVEKIKETARKDSNTDPNLRFVINFMCIDALLGIGRI